MILNSVELMAYGIAWKCLYQVGLPRFVNGLDCYWHLSLSLCAWVCACVCDYDRECFQTLAQPTLYCWAYLSWNQINNKLMLEIELGTG